MHRIVFTLFVIIPLIAGWPTGAPSKACEAMMPKHGNNRPQPAHTSPYSFVQSTDSYRPGDQVIGKCIFLKLTCFNFTFV